MEILLYTGLGFLGLMLIIFLIVTIIGQINKKKIERAYADFETVLKKIVNKDKENYSYKRFITPKKELKKNQYEYEIYDYVLTTKNFNYYIKLVINLDNQEICINNSVKWQLRKSFNDESMRFVENVEGLMRTTLDNINNKENKKLYVIYPNARSLLKYINECEMEFVHPTTDVYGTNVITFVNLKDNIEYIEL